MKYNPWINYKKAAKTMREYEKALDALDRGDLKRAIALADCPEMGEHGVRAYIEAVMLDIGKYYPSIYNK